MSVCVWERERGGGREFGSGERGERIGKWKREGEGEGIMRGRGRVGDGK